MLPKAQRLNLKKDFKWVASGQKIETKLATIFIKTGTNKEARIGVATPTRYFKKAHDRNRARRLVFAAVEKLYPTLANNINIMLLPKTAILDVKSEDVRSAVELALNKL